MVDFPRDNEGTNWDMIPRLVFTKRSDMEIYTYADAKPRIKYSKLICQALYLHKYALNYLLGAASKLSTMSSLC